MKTPHSEHNVYSLRGKRYFVPAIRLPLCPYILCAQIMISQQSNRTPSENSGSIGFQQARVRLSLLLLPARNAKPSTTFYRFKSPETGTFSVWAHPECVRKGLVSSKCVPARKQLLYRHFMQPECVQSVTQSVAPTRTVTVQKSFFFFHMIYYYY